VENQHCTVILFIQWCSGLPDPLIVTGCMTSRITTAV